MSQDINIDILDKYNKNDDEDTNDGDIIINAPNDPETEIIRGVFNTLNEVVKAVKEYEISKEQEATKRYYIRNAKEVALERIKVEKELFEKIIDKTFEERKYAIYELLERLDVGIKTDNRELINGTLGSIVGIVQTSPFKTFDEFNKKMKQKPIMLEL